MVTPLQVEEGTFFVLFFTLAAAVWYAWEARKQAEAQLKPCVTPNSNPRDATDAVLDMDGIRGEEVLGFNNGNMAIRNVGSGPAIHIHYSLSPVNPPPNQNRARRKGYVHVIKPDAEFTLPIPRGALQTYRYELDMAYESLSGQKYRTRALVDNLVLVEFRFQSLRWFVRLWVWKFGRSRAS